MIRPQSSVSIALSASHDNNLHQQALTAANLAFERANERANAKQGPHEHNTPTISDNDSRSKLGRRQSVRFTGATAIPLRNRSITRREAPDYRTDYGPYKSQLVAQSHKVEPSFASNETALAAVIHPVGEFGESDIASVPSSYRRLRKAKSMFSPSKAPSAVFGDGVPYSRRHFHRQSFQSSDTCREPLPFSDRRLRKSYSFLRGVSDRLSTSSRQYETTDAAVQLARDQYLRQLEQQRLKEQPSFIGLGSRRKSQKAFRRTVRTSSTNSYGSAIASPLASVEPPTVKDLGRRARSLSQTIKKKIKRVFKRSSDAEGTIPEQQIKASYPHYGDYISTLNGSEQRYLPVPEPDAELLRRVSSRESLRSMTQIRVENGTRPGSIRSAHSDEEESNGKSRVTSWADSTAANTICVPQTMERKRLSIIKEDGGPHQPSSSAYQREGTSDGYATFRQPVRQSSAGRVTGPVDPKRIFSALQKKIDENNRKAAMEDSESGTDSSFSHRKPRPPSMGTLKRTSSIRKGAEARSSPSLRSHKANVPTSGVFSPSAMDSFNDNFYQSQNQSPDQEYKQQGSPDLRMGLTLQQIAQMNENDVPITKRPLREVKSAFFPPTMRLERSSPSPYRRAMHTSSDAEAESPSHTVHGDHSRSAGRLNAVTGRLRSGSVTESVSIYSRSSGGDAPKGTRSSISLAMSESSGEAGTAVIIMDHSGERDQSSSPVTVQHGYSSVASSGNWRNFMATQVASLEEFGTRQELTNGALPIKDSGHKRENAQVNGDEVNIGRLQSPTMVPRQPFANIKANSNAPNVPKQKISYSQVDRSPLRSIDLSVNTGNAKQNENALLRKTETERRTISHAIEPSGAPKQQNSHSSLKMQTERRGSPATSNSRYSPERAERLRRMKSSSATSLGKPQPQNENHAFCRIPSDKDHDPDGSDNSPSTAQTQAGNNHRLVNSFLKNRRSLMKMSEDSGTDPAFL